MSGKKPRPVWLAPLSDVECDLLRRCIELVTTADWLAWEFHAVVGLDLDEAKEIYAAWPVSMDTVEGRRLALHAVSETVRGISIKQGACVESFPEGSGPLLAFYDRLSMLTRPTQVWSRG